MRRDNAQIRYDSEHNRIEMNAPGTLTKYLSDPASGVMTEHMGPTTAPYADRDYIMADGHMVAIIVTQNSSTTSIYYPILDHLGSVAVIVDGNATLPNGNANPCYGDAIDRYSGVYPPPALGADRGDAWSEARDPEQWTPRTCSDGPQPPFVRGFTGQEQLPAGVCLTNFNARIYNPAIGRFFSADPSIEAPYNPQDLMSPRESSTRPASAPASSPHSMLKVLVLWWPMPASRVGYRGLTSRQLYKRRLTKCGYILMVLM